MAKDPAALLYIDNWLVSTKEMKADERGWYLNLILHQYDKGDLPNDVEELANLADVRFSEYESFKQKWEQVLKQKFEQNEKGRLENPKAKEILQKRELFKDKRSESGKMGYVIKVAIRELKATNEEVEYIKKNIDMDSLDIKNKQVLKQVLKQTIKLYINGDGDKDIIKDRDEFNRFWDLYDKKVGEKDKLFCKWQKLKDADKVKIFETLPNYVASTKKQFRKNPESYFNNNSWNDEIIGNRIDVKLGTGETINEQGQRIYGNNRVVPMDAPPRPSSQHYWNAECKNWGIM